jgi:glycosyltransferase involved in cell wall biosynthesis
MNIMEIVSGTPVNGAILHSLLLTRQLICRGNRVTMVCRPGAWIGQQLLAEGVEVIWSDLHRWPTDELRRVAAIVRERQIDVIHTHMSRAHFFGVLLRWFTRVPCVATAHSRHFQLHWMLNDWVIAVCDATRNYHRRYNLVRANRIETIHNFIDHGRMDEVPHDARPRLRASFGVEPSWPLLGAIGDVVPRKGLIHLVTAMPEVLAAVPDARLLVVGDPADTEYVAQAKAIAEQSGIASRVLWAGRRDDVAEILTALDLFVLPSLEESFPLAILEAMAAGLPVVATTVGGIPECVEPGVTGTLVPPTDSHALAEAIVRLLRQPGLRQQFGEAARRRVRTNFSAESQTPRIEAVFSRVRNQRQAA